MREYSQKRLAAHTVIPFREQACPKAEMKGSHHFVVTIYAFILIYFFQLTYLARVILQQRSFPRLRYDPIIAAFEITKSGTIRLNSKTMKFKLN